MKVAATGTKKSTEEDKARIRELMGDETKMIDDGGPTALLDLPRVQGRHPDRRRPQPLYSTQGAHSFPRHQPGTRIRLRRLRRHGRTGAATGAVDGKPGLGGGQEAGAVGQTERSRHRAGGVTFGSAHPGEDRLATQQGGPNNTESTTPNRAATGKRCRCGCRAHGWQSNPARSNCAVCGRNTQG